MKRWIHASTASNDESAARARHARRILRGIQRDKVKYVEQCYEDVLADISDYYAGEPDARSIHTNEIKRDWLLGAIVDDLMTEEEFNDIYELVEVAGLEDAMTYC